MPARRDRRLVDWSRPELALRSARRWVSRVRRLASWAVDPGRAYPTAPISTSPDRFGHRCWSGAASLERCGADPRLERGKRQNVTLAAIAIDGREIDPQTGFSFWRLVGRPTRARGFALGAEVRAGCVVPTVGGGICLVSNLLFAAASELGWTIVERAGHTLAWSADDQAPDATVAWPDVDLRFVPPAPFRIDIAARGDRLELSIWGERPAEATCAVESERLGASDAHLVRRLWRRLPDGSRELLGDDRKRVLAPERRAVSCFSCGETECHGRPRELRVDS